MLTENRNKCLLPKPLFSYDEACLDIINTRDENIEVYGQYTECDGCNFENFTSIAANSNTSLLINTKYSMQMFYVANNSDWCK